MPARARTSFNDNLSIHAVGLTSPNTDSGAGIPAELIPRVFDPGFTTKRAGGGLGLGICREIVEIHGGYMELASEQGKGTTVRLSLPTRD